MLELYVKAMCWKNSLKQNLKNRLADETGLQAVEMLVFIAIAVGIAFIFREQIANLLDSVFSRATEATKDLGAGSTGTTK